jgi:hypothetical protein
MKNVINTIKEKKYIFWLFTISMNIVFSCGMFPITLKIDLIFSYLLTFFILGGLYSVLVSKLLYIPLINFLFNSIGLLIRYTIEYGEYTIEDKFTTINLVIMLVVVPICVSSFSILRKLIVKHIK